MKPLFYVAGPYSHKDAEVQHDRGKKHCEITCKLLKNGHLVYSPIAETMNLSEYGDMKGNWETWREKDIRQLDVCDEIIVLTLDGWKESIGTRAEIKHSIKNNKTINLYYPGVDVFFSVPNHTVLRELGVDTEDELND